MSSNVYTYNPGDLVTDIDTPFTRRERLAGKTATGVFIGQYEPRDRSGRSLGKIFNVFASPADLDRDGKSYDQTVDALSQKRDWFGFDGAAYTGEVALYDALQNGTYKNEWVMPTRHVFHGHDANGITTAVDNIFEHKDTGALKDTFTQSALSSYWTSTEFQPGGSFACLVKIEDGEGDWGHKTRNGHCRPVRLVEITR